MIKNDTISTSWPARTVTCRCWLGGESAYEPGRICDYILIQDQDGAEIAYAEEIIPEDATEADWDPERFHRLVTEILARLK